MVAVIWMAIGRVASDLSSAREWPISAAITAWPTVAAFISAWQQNSSQTLPLHAAFLVRNGSIPPPAAPAGHRPVLRPGPLRIPR